MKRSIRNRRKKTFPQVPVTSMGDIAFLLIIFFVLCSQFQKVSVNLPVSRDAQEISERPRITVEIDAEGNIYFNQFPVSNAEQVEWKIREMLEGKTQDREKMVLFRCDRNVTRDKYEPVIAAIAKAGGLIVAIGRIGEENK